MRTCLIFCACCAASVLHAQNNVGIGTTSPVEQLDVAGGIRIGSTTGLNPGTFRFLNGKFEGNVDGTSGGWRSFYGPWIKEGSGHYYLSPVVGGGSAAIGDSLFASDGKLIVRNELAEGGTGIHAYLTSGGTTFVESKLAHRFIYAPGNVWNFGMRTDVSNDLTASALSIGVAGLNEEADTANYGGYFVAYGAGENNIGVYGSALSGLQNWAGYFDGNGFFSEKVGIGVPMPDESLEVDGAIRFGAATGQTAGTMRFLNGRFEGNVDGTGSGWRSFDSPWTKTGLNNFYLAPVEGGGSAAIGDSLFTSDGKLIVARELANGRTGVHSSLRSGDTLIAETWLTHQEEYPLGSFRNHGLRTRVYNDSIPSSVSYGISSINEEADTQNWGGIFVASGYPSEKNFGVYGIAYNGQENWAGYFEGNAFAHKLAVFTETLDSEAQMQVNLPLSGNFPHVRISSVVDSQGFGIRFADPSHEFLIGQNIGNWNDGRFTIYPEPSFNGFAMMQDGDIGLTTNSFLTPFARFQVPQKGSLNNADTLEVTHAAIFIGETQSQGMAFDENQIETVGHDLYLNFNSSKDIRLAEGGGKVGIGTDSLIAPFHVAEGETVLFGYDTTGKSNFYPDPKFMWKPGKGGAIRIGQLNADGSLIGGTGYNFWDHSNVGWASVAIGNNTKATGAGSVALGIRSHAGNFGSVALGHLSRALGNSGIAAGYYTRADAFVSTAVGSGNTGGGNANSWVATDPIFEVGNSIDTTNRSNAFTILKNARVGINNSNPQSMLDIDQPDSGPGNGVLLNLTGHGHWETNVDNANDYNFYYNNVLKAYILDTDGAYVQTSDRRLKSDILPLSDALTKLMQLKPVSYVYRDAPDAPRSNGFIAQDVREVFPEMVSEKDGYLGISYQGFSALTVKGLQELAAENAALRQEVEELKQMVHTLLEKTE